MAEVQSFREFRLRVQKSRVHCFGFTGGGQRGLMQKGLKGL